ncbi:MAG TPA: hypothetical protein DEQ77_05515 [Candidatus Omnitrophica bacterium]|nr:hypothetical protein [Candidatus Omnitrophota bacterium]
MKKMRTFKGGYRFLNFEGQPKDILEEASIPSRVTIPLRQGFGGEGDCLVNPGDKVSAGQIIGAHDYGVSSPVHASISGVVTEVKRFNYFKRDCLMVSIQGDGSPEYQRATGATSAWEQLSEEAIERLLYLSGVTALDREGIPTRMRSSVILPEDVTSLIIHGVGSEPYNTSLEMQLQGKHMLNLVEGIRILRKIMAKAKVYLAINCQRKKILEQINKLTAQYEWLEVCPLEPRYPQGFDEMLVSAILGQKFPYGYSAANIGVVILNVQAVLQAYEAVVEGKPLIERTIALCGPAFKEPLHIKARIGTALNDIVSPRIKEGITPRFVLNGILTGPELKDLTLPIDKTYAQILAIPENHKREFLSFLQFGPLSDSYSHTFVAQAYPKAVKSCETNMHGEARPCISCNYCEEVCPVGIIPHLLSKYVQRSIIDETLMNLRIFNCIECGLCSYVCPSKIPLAKHIKEGQEKLTVSGCDRNQCILPYFSNLRGIEEYRGAKQL